MSFTRQPRGGAVQPGGLASVAPPQAPLNIPGARGVETLPPPNNATDPYLLNDGFGVPATNTPSGAAQYELFPEDEQLAPGRALPSVVDRDLIVVAPETTTGSPFLRRRQ